MEKTIIAVLAAAVILTGALAYAEDCRTRGTDRGKDECRIANALEDISDTLKRNLDLTNWDKGEIYQPRTEEEAGR